MPDVLYQLRALRMRLWKKVEATELVIEAMLEAQKMEKIKSSVDLEFKMCDVCAAKEPAGDMCSGCLHNWKLIDLLKQKVADNPEKG
jgi:hypothetical protein